jgi:hypothetical protein
MLLYETTPIRQMVHDIDDNEMRIAMDNVHIFNINNV